MFAVIDKDELQSCFKKVCIAVQSGQRSESGSSETQLILNMTRLISESAQQRGDLENPSEVGQRSLCSGSDRPTGVKRHGYVTTPAFAWTKHQKQEAAPALRSRKRENASAGAVWRKQICKCQPLQIVLMNASLRRSQISRVPWDVPELNN